MSQDPKSIRAAIRNFRRLLELEPRHRGHREQLADLYVVDGRPAEAIRELLGLARDLQRDGLVDDAGETVRKVLELDRYNQDALTLLAGIYASAPRGTRGVSVLEVVDEDPLDELARPEKDAPLDATNLLAVHSMDDLGAEMASQSSIDISVSVDLSQLSVGSAASGDRHRTLDVVHELAAVEPVTLDLSDAELTSDPSVPADSLGNAEASPAPGEGLSALDALAGLDPRALERHDPADSDERTGVREAPGNEARGGCSADLEMRIAAMGPMDDDDDDEVERAFAPTTGSKALLAPPTPPAASLGPSGSEPGVGSSRAPMPTVPLFAALPRAAIADLVEKAERRFFPAQAPISVAGETLDGLYVVISGAVRLSAPVDAGVDGQVADIEPGGHFGEADLNARRIVLCTATAIEPTEVLKVAPDRVGFMRRHYPAFERTLVESGELRIVQTLLAQSALFGALPAKDRAVLAARFRPIALGPGEELVNEGSAANGLYLVTRGSLLIYREGMTLTTLQAGEFLGVVSMLQQVPAACTAIAGPAAQVVCLDADELEPILSSYAGVRESFWRESRSRNPIA